jgi:hypothetical protein
VDNAIAELRTAIGHSPNDAGLHGFLAFCPCERGIRTVPPRSSRRRSGSTRISQTPPHNWPGFWRPGRPGCATASGRSNSPPGPASGPGGRTRTNSPPWRPRTPR